MPLNEKIMEFKVVLPETITKVLLLSEDVYKNMG